MTLDELRDAMNRWWRETNTEALARKDSQSALLALFDYYEELPNAERPFADVVLAEWLHSADPAQRFDAQAMIERYRIASALSSLRARALNLSPPIGPEK